MLKIKNYSYSYGNDRIFNKFSLALSCGDLLSVVGPNGVGKTTLLRSIVTINDEYEGQIILDGIDQRNCLVDYKKNIGYVADEPLLLDYLTGYQYLNFIADVYEVSEKVRKKLIKKYSELFEISGILGNLISTYSHGNKQKIAIISALIHSPKLLILDEPFVGLDPKAIKNIKVLLRELSESGMTIIIASHILSMIEDLSNKTLLINNNRKTKLLTEKNKSLEEVYMEFIDV